LFSSCFVDFLLILPLCSGTGKEQMLHWSFSISALSDIGHQYLNFFGFGFIVGPCHWYGTAITVYWYGTSLFLV
jgi:hypothetical protein